MISKRGVSPIIATVLLIILTLVAVSILSVFVIRFVNDNVQGSDECFNILGKVKFDEASAYNCNYQNSSGARTGFSVRIDTDEVSALRVILTSQGSANSHQIEMNGTDSELRMLNFDFNSDLDVPSKGGVRTYVARGSYERVEINGVLKTGKVCENREVIQLDKCADSASINKLFLY